MWRTAKDTVLILFLTLLFATGLKSCIIDAYKIPTGSMIPSILDGDFVLVNKFIYGARTPKAFLSISIPSIQFPAIYHVQRGHVVVFEFPGEPDETIVIRNLYLVKRCIGLPGDTVTISGGAVQVNGSTMEYFPQAEKDFDRTIVPRKGISIPMDAKNFLLWKTFIRREGVDIQLREGDVFIDGRKSDAYTVRRNYYFVLGDNINKSSDSREWGFVPEEHIVGKAMMIYFSKGSDGIRWERIGTIVR